MREDSTSLVSPTLASGALVRLPVLPPAVLGVLPPAVLLVAVLKPAVLAAFPPACDYPVKALAMVR